MSGVVAKRFLISGRVQGVYFRASTRVEAQKLGVMGYAKNLPDGRVEVLGIGEVDAVEALAAWLWRGSPAAHVVDVVVEDIDAELGGEFRKDFATL